MGGAAAYSIACHGAIRAGKVMTPEEMQELVRQLEACAQPHTCPHGRPTMIPHELGADGARIRQDVSPGPAATSPSPPRLS